MSPISSETDVKKSKPDSEIVKHDLLNSYDDADDEKNDELVNKAEKMKITKSSDKKEAIETTNELPQGFFDDKKKDMEARNINYDSLLDTEFAKFKAELQNEEAKNEIIADVDDEERDIDRHIEEVDQLIENWARVENLHQRKENLVKLKVVKKLKEQCSSDEDDDIDLDSVTNLALRSKNRC
jgi:hypothetical protein